MVLSGGGEMIQAWQILCLNKTEEIRAVQKIEFQNFIKLFHLLVGTFEPLESFTFTYNMLFIKKPYMWGMLNSVVNNATNYIQFIV